MCCGPLQPADIAVFGDVTKYATLGSQRIAHITSSRNGVCFDVLGAPDTLVEEAVKTKLILDSVDACLLTQPTLINKRTRSVLPVVRDRQALVSMLRGLLSDLGLKRRGKGMPSLGEYLATRGTGTPGAVQGAERPGSAAGDPAPAGAAVQE